MTTDAHSGSGPRRGVQSSNPTPGRKRKRRLEGTAGTAALSATSDLSEPRGILFHFRKVRFAAFDLAILFRPFGGKGIARY